MNKAYISGKISGLPIEEATANFEAAEKIVSDMGYEPVNPMKLVPYDPALTWEDYMVADIRALFGCQVIVMLPNWLDSRGARIERAIAFEMGINVIFLDKI